MAKAVVDHRVRVRVFVDFWNFQLSLHERLSTTRLTLARYNGPSHVHEEIHYRAHIHLATAQAIAAGRRPEFHAAHTALYTTLEGAMACLLEDFHVTGVTAKRDQPRRFQ